MYTSLLVNRVKKIIWIIYSYLTTKLQSSSTCIESTTIEGGCLCQSIRYRVVGTTVYDSCYCHCTTCRKVTGAAVVPWYTTQLSNLTWITHQQPKYYESSPNIQRGFCSNCGTTLTYQRHPNVIDITICSLDDPNRIIPEYHVWTEDQIPWLHIQDDNPRFRKESR